MMFDLFYIGISQCLSPYKVALIWIPLPLSIKSNHSIKDRKINTYNFIYKWLLFTT